MMTLKQKLVGGLLASGLATLLTGPISTPAAPINANPGPSIGGSNPNPLPASYAAVRAILDKAAALGAAFTGRELSGVESVPGGYRMRFEYCDIYYSAATGAWEVHGDIRAKYNAVGIAALGLPTTDERVALDKDGRYNDFAKDASIVWSPRTGPMIVRGAIRAYWSRQGGTLSPLGFPTTDERVVGTAELCNQFENGILFVDQSGITQAPAAVLPARQVKLKPVSLLNVQAPVSLRIISQMTYVTDPGWSFWESRNRIIGVRLDIYELYQTTPTFTVDLELLFYGTKDTNAAGVETGSMTCWLSTRLRNLEVRGGSASLQRAVVDAVERLTAQPINTFGIAASDRPLAVKTSREGDLEVYLKPGTDADVRTGGVATMLGRWVTQTTR